MASPYPPPAAAMTAISKPSSNDCSEIPQIRSNFATCSSRVFWSPDFEALIREKDEIYAKCKRTIEKLAALKEKYETLERENGELLLQKVEIEGECSKYRRELKVKEVEIERLEGEVRVSRDRETRANSRYERLVAEIERVGREKDEILIEKAKILKVNRRLEVEKRRAEDKTEEYFEEFEKAKREKDEIMRKLTGAKKRKVEGESRGCSEEKEGEEIQRGVEEEEEEVEREKRKFGTALESRLEEAERRERDKDEEIMELKIKKRKCEAELVSWLEKVRRVEKEKDEIIDGLMKKKEHLEMEKQEFVKKNQMIQKFFKIEEDVVMGMNVDLSSNERFASSHANAFDAVESGFACNALAKENENVQDAGIVEEAGCRKRGELGSSYSAPSKNSSEPDWKGFEFDTIEQVVKFYKEHARSVGFYIRLDYSNKNKYGKISSANFVCNKEGFRSKDKKNKDSKRCIPETRVGCRARLRVNLDRKSGKFRVVNWETEHNHPLRSDETVNVWPSQRNMSFTG